MRWVWIGVELAVETCACWTLAGHACMALGLAAAVAWPLFAAALAVALVAGRRRFRDARGGELGSLAGALAIGSAFGALSLFLLTPSGDDFDFFHRALWQLAHLGEPFTFADTAFAAEGLAAISPLHVLTTWELGIAMTAHALGLDALGGYHNGAIVVAHLVLACVLVLWLRELGFARGAALLGATAAFGFFLADDPHLRSFGIAWRMLWVGKMVQWLVLFPAALLFAFRYARAPSARALVHPLLCGVCAIGLSGSGVFLLPGLFAAASLAMAARLPLERRRVAQAAALSAGSLYCVGVAGLVVSGVLARPDDVRAWTEPFPSEWLRSLGLTVGHAAGAARTASRAPSTASSCTVMLSGPPASLAEAIRAATAASGLPSAACASISASASTPHRPSEHSSTRSPAPSATSRASTSTSGSTPTERRISLRRGWSSASSSVSRPRRISSATTEWSSVSRSSGAPPVRSR